MRIVSEGENDGDVDVVTALLVHLSMDCQNIVGLGIGMYSKLGPGHE